MKKITKLFSALFVFAVTLFGANANAQCNYSIQMDDQWGDGWNGNQLLEVTHGVIVDTFTVTASTLTMPLAVNTGDTINIALVGGPYTSGAPDWNSEVSFELFDPAGTSLYASGLDPVVGYHYGTIAVCPSCPPPVSLTATGITTTAANLGWTESGTAIVWDLEWGTTGFVQGAGTMVVGTTTNPHALTGLTANTAYDFYVRADCGVDSSTWVGPFTFTTPCGAVVAPWIDSVETHTPTTSIIGLSNCWSANPSAGYDWNIDGAGSTPSNNTGPAGAFSGTNYFYIEASGSAVGDTADLYTPSVDLTALTTPSLTFYYHMYGTVMGSLYIDIFNGTTWATVDSIIGQQQVAQTDPWLEKFVNLSAFTGTIQIRFRAVGAGAFEGDISLDNIEVKEAPSCPDPSTLTAANILTTSADLGWAENGSATTWNVEWGATGFTQGAGTSVITTTNPHSLTGLTAQTSYDFYVKSVCGAADSSAWIGPFTFTTPCAPFMAPFTESFDTNVTPVCWSQSLTTGSPWVFGALGAAGWAAAIFDDHTANGGNFAWIDFSGGGNDVGVILEMPDVDVSALTNPALSFWMASYNTDDNDSNVLFIDAWNGSSWVIVDSLQQDDSTWVQHSFNISTFTYGANLTKFRFRAEMDPVGVNFYANDLLIDDINIDGSVNVNANVYPNINLNVYPNPTNGLFTLNVNTTDVNELEIRVMNVQGQVVFSKNNFTNISNVSEQIDLSNNAKGIYFVNVTSDKGVVTHKIIVQ